MKEIPWMLTNKSNKTHKKTLDDFLNDKTIITGKDVVQNIKEKERQQKEFSDAVEVELRNRRLK